MERTGGHFNYTRISGPLAALDHFFTLLYAITYVKRKTSWEASMPDFGKPSIGIQRSRRNLVKMGVIGVSAAFASLTTTRPSAGQTNPNPNQGPGQNPGQTGQNNSCFLKGTTIRTADGDRKIEDLVVGDLLPTAFGATCAIQWIGYYPYKRSDQAEPWVKDALPVRVAGSALGPNTPHADLYVSKRT